MSYTDRYAITEFAKDPNQNFSLSLDEMGGPIVPVILIVPDKTKHDHEHIEIYPKKIPEFITFLTTKGHSKFDNGMYQLVIHNYSLTDNTVEVELYLHYKNETPRKLYTVTLDSSALEKMHQWMMEYTKFSQAELLERFNKDLKKLR